MTEITGTYVGGSYSELYHIWSCFSAPEFSL